MQWTHVICDECWGERHPSQRPCRLMEEYRKTVACCFCGETTRSGIYVRENPDVTFCQGECAKEDKRERTPEEG